MAARKAWSNSSMGCMPGRWLARTAPGRGDLDQQRPRFTADLFELLKQAWDLDPRTDGAYLDFDVFSGTQMAT